MIIYSECEILLYTSYMYIYLVGEELAKLCARLIISMATRSAHALIAM